VNVSLLSLVLEEQNSKLKRIGVDFSLAKAMLEDVLSKKL
jgi:hypothetical protein